MDTHKPKFGTFRSYLHRLTVGFVLGTPYFFQEHNTIIVSRPQEQGMESDPSVTDQNNMYGAIKKRSGLCRCLVATTAGFRLVIGSELASRNYERIGISEIPSGELELARLPSSERPVIWPRQPRDL